MPGLPSRSSPSERGICGARPVAPVVRLTLGCGNVEAVAAAGPRHRQGAAPKNDCAGRDHGPIRLGGMPIHLPGQVFAELAVRTAVALHGGPIAQHIGRHLELSPGGPLQQWQCRCPIGSPAVPLPTSGAGSPFLQHRFPLPGMYAIRRRVRDTRSRLSGSHARNAQDPQSWQETAISYEPANSVSLTRT